MIFCFFSVFLEKYKKIIIQAGCPLELSKVLPVKEEQNDDGDVSAIRIDEQEKGTSDHEPENKTLAKQKEDTKEDQLHGGNGSALA